MTDSLKEFLKAHREKIDRERPDYIGLFDAIYENLNNEDTVELIYRLTELRPQDKIEFYRSAKLYQAIDTAFQLWDQAKRFPNQYDVEEFIEFWIKNDLGYPLKEIIENIKDVYKDWSNKFIYILMADGTNVIRKV